MNHAERLMCDLEDFCDRSNSREERLQILARVVDAVVSLRAPGHILVAWIQAAVDQTERREWDETFLSHAIREIRGILYPRDICGEGRLVVLVGASWLREELWKRRFPGIQLVKWEYTDPKFDEEVNTFLLCSADARSLVSEHAAAVNRSLDLFCLCGYQFYNPWLYKRYQELEEQSLRDDLCLVTGMSYIRDAIDPAVFALPVLRMAESSQDIYYDRLCLQEVLSRGLHVKKLIIGLAPYSLRYDLSLTKNPVEMGRMYFYYSRYQDWHNRGEQREELEAHVVCRARMKELFGGDILDVLFGIYCRGKDLSFSEGMEDCFSGEGSAELEKQMVGKYHKPYEETRRENERLLRDYIALADREGIDSCLFIPPFSQWYKERWDAAYLRELRTYIRSLGRDFSFQTIDMAEEDWPDYCFRDGAHLNRVGGMLVSARIAEKMGISV